MQIQIKYISNAAQFSVKKIKTQFNKCSMAI